MQVLLSNSEAETEEIGARFAKDLPGGTVVAMYGDLGAGKTAFVRGMARGMGLIHFDMYRLSGADELFEIGWEDYLSRGAVCAVEWSEKVEDAFFGDEVRVTIEKLGDSRRKITIEGADVC